MNQNILNALDALLATAQWDKLVLLTPVDTWYSFLADRVPIPIITVSVEEGAIKKRLSDIRESDYVIHLPCAVTGAEDLFNLSVALSMTEGALSYQDSVIFLGATLDHNAHCIYWKYARHRDYSKVEGPSLGIGSTLCGGHPYRRL